MAVKFGNNAATLLAANASSSATVLTVSDGSVFPTLSGADYTYVTLEDVNSNREIVKVTAISGNELTVVRAQDGSSARAFSTSDKCELRITAALLNAVSTETVNGTSARFKFTATANQTTFSGSDDNSVTLEYNVGYIDLYLSGIRLIAGSDYTASNGTSIVLAAGASVNDIIEIVSYGTFVLADIAINDMTDVNTTGIADGSILAYDNTDARFEKSTILSQSSSGVAVVGNITVTGTVDGRDIATDGGKLDGIEASADVTDATNVTAAGALMDSELTSIASVKALNQGVATTDSPTFADVVAASLDISGDIDVDGTTNLDATNIVGALDVTGTSQINGYLETDNSHNYFKSNSTSNASLTLRKNASGADSIDFLQLRNNANGLIGKIEGDGDISFASATFSGSVTANAGVVVDNITIDGNEIDVGSGDLTLDVAGNIVLDADGGEVKFDDGGTRFANLYKSSNNFVVSSAISDGDIIFKGNDNGSTITALTLDMSAAGAATFNAGVTMDGLTVDGAATIEAATGHLRLQGTANTNKNLSLLYNESGDYGQINCDESGVNQKDLWVTGLNLKFGRSTGSESMTIDSSGNLLVGVTSTATPGVGNTTAGVSIRGDDGSFFSRSLGSGDTNNVVSFNRSTAGNILGFQKDGTTVGSIGVVGGDDLFIAGGATGLRFDSDTAKIYPTNGSGAVSNGALDIGETNFKFRDLYLSGKIAKGTGGELDLRSDGGGFKYKQNLDVATAGCTFTGQSNRGDVAQIRLYQTATGADGGYIRFDTSNSGSTTPTEKARIDSSGNVGIGVTNPSDYYASWNNLVVGDTSGSAGMSIVTGTSNEGTIAFADGTSGVAQYKGYIQYNQGVDRLVIGVNSTERMRIDSSGRVGIGCVPQSNLDIDVGLDTSLGLRSQTGVIVAQYTGAPAVGNRAQIGLGYGNTYTNVSIGAVRTSAAAYGTDDFIIATKSGTADTAPTERMRIESSGNLLVGATGTPTTGGFKFDVGSDSLLRVGHASGVSTGSNYLLFYYGSSVIGSVVQTGTTQVSYNTSSDQRLKDNIADADDAGSKVDAIQVRKFDWKADGSHQDYGMIAQELQAVAPEAVSGDADSEEMMGVDYSKLVPMLIKEIQSLRNRVAQLEE